MHRELRGLWQAFRVQGLEAGPGLAASRASHAPAAGAVLEDSRPQAGPCHVHVFWNEHAAQPWQRAAWLPN